METNIPDVYAIGDVTEAFHAITKEPIYLPLATTAVKMGRIAGDLITGGQLRFNGVLGTKVSDLFQLDLAFTPPISTPVDPVMFTGITLFNAIHNAPLVTPAELNEQVDQGNKYLLIDLRANEDFKESHITGAVNIPMDEIEKDKKIVLYSSTGENGYIPQETLLNKGYEDIYNLSGGIENHRILYSDRLVK